MSFTSKLLLVVVGCMASTAYGASLRGAEDVSEPILTLPSGWSQSKAIGGWGGDRFDDYSDHLYTHMTSIDVYVGKCDGDSVTGKTVVGKIVPHYDARDQDLIEDKGVVHGTCGTRHSFSLGDGEFVVAIYIRSGDKIDQIAFKTNTGRSSEVYGGPNGEQQPPILAPHGTGVRAIYGRAGRGLDQIGFYFGPDCLSIQKTEGSWTPEFYSSQTQTVSLETSVSSSYARTDAKSWGS